ncbi:MAG: nucleoside hydrolase [Chloroflexaceae bacterium]|jgi:purine nucleosidase|nr:nucleoside hydrolase [Chloroflexaceae bacterium]
MQPRPVVLDVDPGIDDALAILLALASPEIELRAVTVTGGNCPLAEGVRNGLDVLALGGGAHVPLAAGVALPIIRPPFTAPETHGATGLGYAKLPPSPAAPIAEHGVDRLINEIMATPGEVTLVAVAPLTNVALAIRKEPRIVQAVREVIVMGGAVRADGNTTPLAEFNVYVDPHAAHVVLHSGIPQLTIIPWDITINVRITQTHVDRLLALGGPIPAFIAEAVRFYLEFHEAHFGFAACSINDPAALALAFLPDLAQTTPIYMDVEINSETTMGKTVGDFLHLTQRPPNVRLVTAFDNERFVELFLERMEKLTRNS